MLIEQLARLNGVSMESLHNHLYDTGAYFVQIMVGWLVVLGLTAL